jgi:diphosphomevalonate decarboxylase
MNYQSSWRSPSNIALIKYWGKFGLQLPRNPSLSLTLSVCHTDMKVSLQPKQAQSLTVLYNGNEKPDFQPKIKSLFQNIRLQFPWLESSSVLIDSINTFPHGSGIASSASAMSALALCLHDIDHQLKNKTFLPDAATLNDVSKTARIGSGSAARSLYPIASLWGETQGVDQSNNEFAIPWENEIDEVYKTYHDTILIVSSEEKSVSSTAGHKLMDTLSYAETRYAEATKNISALIEAMRSSEDQASFISICESEALQLHALMMSGTKPYILMQPATLAILKEVWKYRADTGLPVCFTLDAGPNVHLLYPASIAIEIKDWISHSLSRYCFNGSYIHDVVGNGPQKIE